MTRPSDEPPRWVDDPESSGELRTLLRSSEGNAPTDAQIARMAARLGTLGSMPPDSGPSGSSGDGEAKPIERVPVVRPRTGHGGRMAGGAVMVVGAITVLAWWFGMRSSDHSTTA